MPLRFPKQLTIQLPELHREALHTIQEHDVQQEPARLLEGLLARGIYSKLRTLNDATEEPTHEADEADEWTVDLDDIPRSVTLNLDREQRDRIAVLLRDTPQADLGSVILCVFEWGLDALSENLSIEASSPDKGDGAE